MIFVGSSEGTGGHRLRLRTMKTKSTTGLFKKGNTLYLKNKHRIKWAGPLNVFGVIRNDLWKAWSRANLPLTDLVRRHNSEQYDDILNDLYQGCKKSNGKTGFLKVVMEMALKGQFFYPIEFQWMVAMCHKLLVPPPEFPPPHVLGKRLLLTQPLQRVNVLGDGNCWFRSISYWVTGTEEHHFTIRKALMKVI